MQISGDSVGCHNSRDTTGHLSGGGQGCCAAKNPTMLRTTHMFPMSYMPPLLIHMLIPVWNESIQLMFVLGESVFTASKTNTCSLLPSLLFHIFNLILHFTQCILILIICLSISSIDLWTFWYFLWVAEPCIPHVFKRYWYNLT